MGGFSQKLATAVLKFYFKGKEEGVTKPAAIYLSLLTATPTSATLGSELTEATGATGYVKKEIPFADMSATEAATSVIENSVEELFAAITAGEATVIAWAITDKSGAKEGNVLAWGTATSTVISSTQTPPTIKAKGLKIELK